MATAARSNAGRVNLTKYVCLNGNKWRFCRVVESANGRVRQDRVWVGERQEFHNEGAYYLDWYENGRRQRQSVGKNAQDAANARHRKELVLKGIDSSNFSRSLEIELAKPPGTLASK